ncbi:MAG: acyl carrier protein [Bryobacteraceae bacterium]|nr:acyl carrier protein [Bryobacteraceae bacterium]
MASTEITVRIRSVLNDSLGLNLSETDLRFQDRISALVAFDSVAILQFVTGLEKEFGIVVEPDWLQIDRLGDLPRLATYVESRVAQLRAVS